MTFKLQTLAACGIAFAAFAISAPAWADPTAIGTFKDWSVYTNGSGKDKVCYVLSQPKDSSPKNVKRDPIFFLISTWPARHVVNEPSVVPGYTYKDESKVNVGVGSDKFEFFTSNDGDAGGAWMQNTADEKRLIDTMKRGADMAVTGTSTRGTLTRDTYSLGGISAALDKVAAICK
jgi:Invasion associated locus B (IalB) protein